jgi:hypothetical protein
MQTENSRTGRGWGGRLLAQAFLGGSMLTLLALTAGCASPGVAQQRLVSKPNMLFSDSLAFNYNSPRLLPQLETGSAASGGAQGSGCTACR